MLSQSSSYFGSVTFPHFLSLSAAPKGHASFIVISLSDLTLNGNCSNLTFFTALEPLRCAMIQNSQLKDKASPMNHFLTSMYNLMQTYKLLFGSDILALSVINLND